MDNLEFILELMDNAWRDQRWPRGVLQRWVNDAVRSGALPLTAGGKASRAAFDKVVAENARRLLATGTKRRGRPPRNRNVLRDRWLAGEFTGMTVKEIEKRAGGSESTILRAMGRKK